MKDFTRNNTLAVVIVALVVGAGAIATGSVIEKRSEPEMHQEQIQAAADQAFIEEMIPHHDSAIEMAELAEDRAESPEVKTLAAQIIKDQQREIAQMKAWYQAWYGKPVPAATGGEHGGGHSAMMNGDDVEALQTAENFDLEFVRRMIPHHQSAVAMAQNVLPKAERQEIKDLAQAIIASQVGEIDQMRRLEGELQN